MLRLRSTAFRVQPLYPIDLSSWKCPTEMGCFSFGDYRFIGLRGLGSRIQVSGLPAEVSIHRSTNRQTFCVASLSHWHSSSCHITSATRRRWLLAQNSVTTCTFLRCEVVAAAHETTPSSPKIIRHSDRLDPRRRPDTRPQTPALQYRSRRANKQILHKQYSNRTRIAILPSLRRHKANFPFRVDGPPPCGLHHAHL